MPVGNFYGSFVFSRAVDQSGLSVYGFHNERKGKRHFVIRRSYYLLTERGLALAPVIVELASWSDNHLRDLHPSIADGPEMELLRSDKVAFANALEKKYREKLAARTYERDAG